MKEKDKQKIIKLFEKVNPWKRGGIRAPHKPLLILVAIHKCISENKRLISFKEADEIIRPLLIDFGPTRKSYHPEYPFWRLQNDNLWEIKDAHLLSTRKGNTDAKRRELLKHNSLGGFPEYIYKAIRKDSSLTNEIIHKILSNSFPESIQDELLIAIGFRKGEFKNSRKKRDGTFRDKIIRAYEHRCAICGYNLKLGNSNLGLEAAHIRWHMAEGPDVEENGLALCVMHHKLFDRGAFTVSENQVIRVSQHVFGSNGLVEWLLRFHDKPIIKAQSKNYFPKKKYLVWHWNNVFRSPARQP